LALRHGRPARGALLWEAQSFELALEPFEVITLRVRQRGGQWEAVQCDMIERTF
jgi:hypothetical protein